VGDIAVEGRVKGDTLGRIWRTFVRRGHDARVGPRLRPALLTQLKNGWIYASEWYPIEYYLSLYGALRDLAGHDEVVATAHASVLSSLTQGSWRVFVPIIAGLAPDAFCQRGIRRFELVYKITFEPGEAKVNAHTGGAEVSVTRTPWSADLAWRGGVTGGLLTVATIAKLKGSCVVSDGPEGQVTFTVRWTKP
jgi:hypothetical protein